MPAKPKCRRCDLFEMAKEDAERIEEYKAMIKPCDRASEEEYERRLLVCEKCGLLNAGTCTACGCYVELRAFGKSGRCPRKKW